MGIAALGHFIHSQRWIFISPRNTIPRIFISIKPQRPEARSGNNDVACGRIYQGTHAGHVADGRQDVGCTLDVYFVGEGPGVRGPLPEADYSSHVEYHCGRLASAGEFL